MFRVYKMSNVAVEKEMSWDEAIYNNEIEYLDEEYENFEDIDDCYLDSDNYGIEQY